VGFPAPEKLGQGEKASKQGFTASYWLFMCAGTCFAAGLMSYELVSYHLTRTQVVSAAWAPVLLAFATGCGVIASLVMGKAFDRFGFPVVVVGVVVSSLFVPLAFATDQRWLVMAVMPLLGIGYAVQDTLLKAIVAGVLPEGRRNLAFGLFYLGYGCGWLIGSIVMGLLYENSRIGLLAFALLAQLASLPFFWMAQRHEEGKGSHREPAGS
jgi:predicted MFS family arabinose efflux permease